MEDFKLYPEKECLDGRLMVAPAEDGHATNDSRCKNASAVIKGIL